MSEPKFTPEELARMCDALPEGFMWGDPLQAHQLREILSAMGYFDLLEVARESLAVIPVIKPPSHGNGTIVRLEDAIAKATGAPRFANVSCSACGKGFGPGNHGFIHCEHHGG